jgi:glycosyltransferase involved in cell wall biosynthesis
MRLLPHGLGMPGQEHRSHAPPEDQVRFVYIGPFIRPKGAHVVVSAFLGLSDPRAQLHLYGDQEADPAYTAELRLLAADPRVTLRGTLSRAGVRAVLAAADVLVLPSLWYEAHSLVVDEAFEAGLPVLVSDHSAAAERVQDGVNGLVAPPGDVAAWRQRMARLLDEPGLLARLQAGVTAPARLADHARQIETIYLQVLAPAAERAGLRR